MEVSQIRDITRRTEPDVKVEIGIFFCDGGSELKKGLRNNLNVNVGDDDLYFDNNYLFNLGEIDLVNRLSEI